MNFYELLGTQEENKEMIVNEEGDYIPRAQRAKETIAWLDQYLGPLFEGGTLRDSPS